MQSSMAVTLLGGEGLDGASLWETVRVDGAGCCSTGDVLCVGMVGEEAEEGSCRLRGVLSV